MILHMDDTFHQTNEQTLPSNPSVIPLPKESALRLFAFGVLGVLVLCAAVGYMLLAYQVKTLSTHPFVMKAAGVLRMPTAIINDKPVLYAEYIADRDTLKRYYAAHPPENGLPPTDEQISDQVLSRLLANTLVASVADQYEVRLTDEEKARAKTALLAKFPSSAEAEAELQKQYGWSVDTYAQKIVWPLAREEKLSRVYASSTDAFGAIGEEEQVRARHILFAVKDPKDDAAVKARAEGVLKRVRAGEDFAKLAKQYGGDGTKDSGGDLGWFGKGVMVPEFEAAVFSRMPQEFGDLVKSPFGYHIVEVQEKRTARNFVKFMDTQLKNAKVKMLIRAHDPFEAVRLNTL